MFGMSVFSLLWLSAHTETLVGLELGPGLGIK